MAVWLLRCPACEHEFLSLVREGTRVPTVWVCGACGSRDARVQEVRDGDPFTDGPDAGCGCG